MSQNKPSEYKEKLLNSLNTYRTMVDNYPLLESVNSLLDNRILKTTSTEFIIDLFKVLGVDNNELIQWLTTLINDDGENGVLNGIEDSIKLIIKSSLTSILTCNQNPIINDELLTHYIDNDNNIINGSGVSIPLNMLDTTGKFRISPLDETIGKYYYYDIDYNALNMYKSKDFDAYLWYVINKGLTINQSETDKLFWVDKKNGNSILYSEFTEYTNVNSNILTFKINYDLYGDKIRGFNKTIYEFNNDLINSIKFFDPKTLVSQIMDKMTGALTTRLSLSVDEIIIQEKIERIINKVIESDDTNISDCFFTFSNDEYDMMIEKASLLHSGVYSYDDSVGDGFTVDYNDILSNLDSLNVNSTLQEQITSIEGVISDFSLTFSENISSSSQNLAINVDNMLINNFIKYLSYALISPLLSPKVMVVYLFNLKMLNKPIPSSIDEFLNTLLNPIIRIITQVKNIIIDKLYEYLMDKLQPLLLAYNQRLLLENAIDAKALLDNLINLTIKIGNDSNSDVVDVNHADIINDNTSTPPKQNC